MIGIKTLNMEKYIRYIVLFTMGDEDREQFLEKIKSDTPLCYSPLQDQSSFTVKGLPVSEVREKIKNACPKENDNQKYFVKLYYSAALVNTKGDNKDCIVECKIW